MEERQLEFVENQFIHIGAKEVFTADLVEKLKAYEPLIKHEYTKAYPDGAAHAVFHVKRSAITENYFLSKMDMSTILAGTNIKHGNTFYFNHRNYDAVINQIIPPFCKHITFSNVGRYSSLIIKYGSRKCQAHPINVVSFSRLSIKAMVMIWGRCLTSILFSILMISYPF